MNGHALFYTWLVGMTATWAVLAVKNAKSGALLPVLIVCIFASIAWPIYWLGRIAWAVRLRFLPRTKDKTP